MLKLHIRLHIMYVYGRVRTMEEQEGQITNTKSQSSQHDTTSIITPRHYNTQFNGSQASQIRR